MNSWPMNGRKTVIRSFDNTGTENTVAKCWPKGKKNRQRIFYKVQTLKNIPTVKTKQLCFHIEKKVIQKKEKFNKNSWKFVHPSFLFSGPVSKWLELLNSANGICLHLFRCRIDPIGTRRWKTMKANFYYTIY